MRLTHQNNISAILLGAHLCEQYRMYISIDAHRGRSQKLGSKKLGNIWLQTLYLGNVLCTQI